jgi:ATP-binding cassette subfamily B protein/subfamily B ATP-binding cassette protein MsbA
MNNTPIIPRKMRINEMRMPKSAHLQYLKKLRPFIFNNKKVAIGLIVIKFTAMLVALFPPLVYQYYINQVITDGQLQKLIYVILGYVLLFIIQSLLVIFARYAETKFMNRIRVDLKQRLLDIYSSMYYIDYEREDIGEMRLRVESDTNAICSFYATHCLNYIFAILYSAIVIVILFLMNWYLILFGCFMIVLSYFITKVLGERIKRTSEKYRTDQSEFDTTIHEALQNWKEIKLNNLEDKEVMLLSEKWSLLSKSILKSTRYRFLHGALVAFNLFFITRMNLYFFGGLLIINDLMTVPTMLVFMNYYEQLYSNIQTILNSTVSLNGEIPQIDRVLSTLEYVNPHRVTDMVGVIEQLQGDIRLENVSFRYQNSDQDVIKNINAAITQYRSLAIVGESGSGKTTLVKLLVGLYQPSEGAIYLNHTEVQRVPDEIKCRFINIVMQDPQLFNMSILENLLMAKYNATMEEIDDVCKMANIYEFIQSIPEKYDTLIGEKGVKLSGGQKQRLAIARTLLLNPQILIFDEATSSLDSENESIVVKSIRDLSKFKTVITISHRFSTISKSDDVIIIRDGRIIERGQLERVFNESKPFASIFNNNNMLNNKPGV